MPEPLKNLFNRPLLEQLSNTILKAKSKFNKSAFMKSVFDKDWERRELKDRMRHISLSLNKQLSGDYSKDVNLLLSTLRLLQKQGVKEFTIEYMFFPDYIEVFGLADFTTSVKAMEEITQFTSCEFAVRPYMIKYEKPMLKQMHKWSTHQHHMVRRLATEGCRPRLPWAMALPALKKDPNPILSILERLKNDPAEIVRRSVANNLNDISKDHPDLAFSLAQNWKGESPEVDWVVKHACRTLLKQGRPEVMQLFGFGSIEAIKMDNFQVHRPIVKIGEALAFSFTIKNTNTKKTKIRLEYAIYYLKANGSLSKKVFKISEREYAGMEESTIERKQSFRIITTKVFHPGGHEVALIVNGNELDRHAFELVI